MHVLVRQHPVSDIVTQSFAGPSTLPSIHLFIHGFVCPSNHPTTHPPTHLRGNILDKLCQELRLRQYSTETIYNIDFDIRNTIYNLVLSK